MKTISGLAFLLFGLLSPSPTPQAASKAPAAPAQGVWAKLDETLNTAFTRPGDKIAAITQQDISVNNVLLPKGTKLTGKVLQSVNQDKQHTNAGMILLFDMAVTKDGKALPVKVMMASIAPSHSDEVEKIDLGSGAGAPGGTRSPNGGGSAVSSPLASRSTDANWIAATVMGVLDDPNVSPTSNSKTELNGQIATSSIKGVTLVASPSGKSSGVVVALSGPLQLTKWTRINMMVSTQ
jgi:hypothetical protein